MTVEAGAESRRRAVEDVKVEEKEVVTNAAVLPRPIVLHHVKSVKYI